ncbi:MAG: putative addiction module antidote protein [Desulfovibrionales bacterium GWA2_65_9]|nr:MAG: putative addiction module antidote protein [Desulfovibrionales bacterium GWA2_65_9]
MTRPTPPALSHDAALMAELRADPAFAAEYLRAALEESLDEPSVLLTALRRVAEAHGMQRVAERAGVNRESLYRSLSPRGNPTVKTLAAVLKAVGLRLTTEPDPTRPSV